MELTVSDINELMSIPGTDKNLSGTYFRIHPSGQLDGRKGTHYQKVLKGEYVPPRGEGMEVLEVALNSNGEAKIYTHQDPFYRNTPFVQITQEEFGEAFDKAVEWLTKIKNKE